MSPRSDGAEPLDSQAVAARPPAETRPLYWSVRRELWENRSIVVAPLAVTAIVLLASLISLFGLPQRMRMLPTLDAAAQHALVTRPFNLAPAPIMFTALLVGFFYCLDALYGERRDRSILFWKSMPVSDRTTVLSKAVIPLAVLPAIALGLSLATFLALLILSTLVLAASGVSPAPLWAEVGVVEEPLVMLYGLTVHALWFAPIYGWLLLVSAWARRTPVIWAALPFLAVAAVEGIVFNTTRFGAALGYRVTGAMAEAFGVEPGALEHLSQLTPGRFLASRGLWLGLVFAAACFAAAVRLRRDREPI